MIPDSMGKTPTFGLTSGRGWQYKCLLVSIASTFLFTTSPSILTQREVRLPPAYELKSQAPFADTSTLTIPEHEGERSHGAKLTPRLTGSALLYTSSLLDLHPYTFPSVFGILFLFSGLRIGHLLSHDRLTSLFISLLFAGLYASSACFSINWMPKPFDGIAIGLAALTAMSIKNEYLVALFSFLCFWTDERAFISIALICLFIYAFPYLTAGEKRDRLIAIGLAFMAYAISRLLVSYALGWHPPNVGMIGINARRSAAFLPLAGWVCFEGGWLLIVASVYALYSAGMTRLLALHLLALGAAVLACVVVLDVSRVSSFAFPVILISIAALVAAGVPPRGLKTYTGSAALITLLAPNFEVITGVAVKWLPSFLSILIA